MEIRPGLAAEVELVFEAHDARERLLVPEGAVGADSYGRFVYVLEGVVGGLGMVHRAEVEVGELTTDGLELLAGVTDGDLLVTGGIQLLHDKQRVRIPESKRED